MNKMVIAGLAAAALSLTALASQRASAQCPPQCQRGGEITFNTGDHVRLSTARRSAATGCRTVLLPCPYGYPPPPPHGYAGNQFQPPMPAPVAAPSPPAPKGPAGAVQNIGYNYPAYDYSAAYNYGYMYGVPPYQAPAYWYGSGYGY